MTSEAARLIDGLTDDYEYWDKGRTERRHKGGPIP